jgi:hypothetical protein
VIVAGVVEARQVRDTQHRVPAHIVTNGGTPLETF